MYSLNHHLWFAMTWVCVVSLYSLRASSLAPELSSDISLFFVFAVLLSLLFGMLSNSPRPVASSSRDALFARSVTDRLLLLPVLALGVTFMLDWMYQGGIPLMAERGYKGFDPSVSTQESVGIPVIHVVVVAVTIFYMLLLAYLLSLARRRSTLLAFFACSALLLLNQSRGYMVFGLVMLALFMIASSASRNPGIRGRFLTLVIAALATSVFIGVFGNLRLGGAWDDFTALKVLGGFGDPAEASLWDWHSWTYVYLTSPLSNLVVTIAGQGSAYPWWVSLMNLLPETFTADLRAEILSPAIYAADQLNASTGFALFARTSGVVGLYVGFLGSVVFLTLFDRVMRRLGHLVVFSRGVSVLFVIAGVFYNPFSTVALAFLPYLTVMFALFLRRRSALRERAASVLSPTSHHTFIQEAVRPRCGRNEVGCNA